MIGALVFLTSMMVIVVIGPGGGVWAVMRGATKRIEERFSDFVRQMKEDHDQTREWLKALQVETSVNTKDIAVLDATTIKKKS